MVGLILWEQNERNWENERQKEGCCYRAVGGNEELQDLSLISLKQP